MLLMQAQENGAVLDEEQLLFLTGEHVTNFDDDMDDPLEQDLALNVDHVFEAEDPIYDKAGPSYDSDIPSESLKAQLKGKTKCVTVDPVKPKVLAPGMYAIDVEPIRPRLKNNRDAHSDYLKHLKESVETVCEVVEEARLEKHLDNVQAFACSYTKRSQELLEYVIGTCPKEFIKRDNKAAITPLTWIKQVTFNDTCETLTNNTQKHVVQQKVHQSNVSLIPSTRVSSSTEASGSKPRSNKKNKILPTKSETKKKVKDHHRTNKYSWIKVNRVDSSISSKHVVIDSNSESVCKTCNKCLISANYDMCVVKTFNSVNATPTFKIGCSKHMTRNLSKVKNFMSKFIGTVRFRNDHFGAIMGYGDYVIDDNVISRINKLQSFIKVLQLDLLTKTPKLLKLLLIPQLTLSLENLVLHSHHQGIPVSTRKQLASDALWCCYHTELSKVKPKNFKTTITEDCCEDLEKLQATADMGIFVGYAPSRKGYRTYNKRT
nr:integrase, catalytic region, zinc finger, CCHC-type, peptidase aspartic, catalytic [Tanacetum cinerariifolium]